jgi:hypothetical protein
MNTRFQAEADKIPPGEALRYFNHKFPNSRIQNEGERIRIGSLLLVKRDFYRRKHNTGLKLRDAL